MTLETKIAIGVVTGLVAGSMATSALFVAPSVLHGAFLRGRAGGPAMMRGWTGQRGPGAEQGWQRGPASGGCPFYGQGGAPGVPGDGPGVAPDGGASRNGRRGPGMMFRRR